MMSKKSYELFMTRVLQEEGCDYAAMLNNVYFQRDSITFETYLEFSRKIAEAKMGV